MEMAMFKPSEIKEKVTKRRNYYAVLCIVFIILLDHVVCSEQVNFKRHSQQNVFESSTGNPMTHSTYCRKVCGKVQDDCSANCYNPKGTAHTLYATTWVNDGVTYSVRKHDLPKYQCFDKCLTEEGDNLYVIPHDCSVISQDDPEEQQPTPTKKNVPPQVIDTTKMTSKQRCRLPAYRNSTVCKFEQDSPDTAKRVFESNRPKLTLCTGGTVMSGERGLYTKRARKSFLAQQDQLRLSNEFQSAFQNPKRSGRSSDDDEGDSTTLKRRKRTKRSLASRIKRQSVRRSERQGNRAACPTETNIESPSKAIHRATELIVDMYFHNGYSQWFEVGTCKDYVPVGISGGGNARCGMALTAHKAYIMIEPSKMRDADVAKFKSCGRIPNLDKYQVCWDWVYLPSHCKFYFS